MTAQGRVPRRHRPETRMQLLQKQAKPQLAEDEEPGFRQDVTAMPRDAISLADVLKLTLLVGQSRDNPLSPRP
jgi:hypothetical protein